MSSFFSKGDRLVLATAGVANATPQYWGGGRGMFMAFGATATTAVFQFSPDSGTTWIGVPAEGGAGGAAPTISVAGMASFNFCLPPCVLRVTTPDASLNAMAVGI